MIARIRRALKGSPWSREEIQEFIEQSETDLDADEKSMLSGVLEVSETQVRDVMVPRSHMVVIDIDEEFDDILKTIVQSGHSRFPVVGEDRDEVLGVLLAKDLLQYCGENAKKFNLRDVVRKAVFVPESKRLNVLLKEFRTNRNHMAVVIDEYGTAAGLVTIEDVLEQIVGEIEDEFDVREHKVRKLSGGRYLVSAGLTLRDMATANKNMAEGRTFIGQQTLDAGLVDTLGSMETALEAARAHGGLLGLHAARGGVRRSPAVAPGPRSAHGCTMQSERSPA